MDGMEFRDAFDKPMKESSRKGTVKMMAEPSADEMEFENSVKMASGR